MKKIKRDFVLAMALWSAMAEALHEQGISTTAAIRGAPEVLKHYFEGASLNKKLAKLKEESYERREEMEKNG